MRKLFLNLVFIFTLGVAHAGQKYDPTIGEFLHPDPQPSVVGGLNLYNSVSNNMVNGYAGGLRYDYGMDFFIFDLSNDSGLDPYGKFRFKFGPEFDVKVLCDQCQTETGTSETEKELILRHIKEAIKTIDKFGPYFKAALAINKASKESKHMKLFIQERLENHHKILKKIKDEFTYNNYTNITFIKDATITSDATHKEKTISLLSSIGSFNSTEYILLPTAASNTTRFPDKSDDFNFTRTLIHEASHSREHGLQTEDYGLDDGQKNKRNLVDKERGSWSNNYAGWKNGKIIEDLLKMKNGRELYHFFRLPAVRWCAKYKKYPNK